MDGVREWLALAVAAAEAAEEAAREVRAAEYAESARRRAEEAESIWTDPAMWRAAAAGATLAEAEEAACRAAEAWSTTAAIFARLSREAANDAGPTESAEVV